MTRSRLPGPVAVVGAGRVGRALASALDRAGVAVIGPAGRSAGAVPAEVARGAEVVVLAVPDDAIGAVGAALPVVAGQVVAHTSGRHGLGVLGERPLRAAMHPCMTFAGTAADASRLGGVTFGVTADDGARAPVATLIDAIGGRVEWIADAARPLYHAALAAAANHLVALVAESADWLRAAGVAEPYDALAPLVRAAAENTLAAGDAALTGPVVRGDAAAVAAHLDALRSAGTSRDAVAAYAALARLAARRAYDAGRLPADRLAALLAVLPPVP